MVLYEDKIRKKIKKNVLPKSIIKTFHNAFLSIDLTKDLSLFDIKKLKGSHDRTYHRLRKDKYRAIFYFEETDIYIIDIDKREDVYNSWL
jgi:mRNA interferase RelE/StbE